jgi:hypothetical protein
MMEDFLSDFLEFVIKLTAMAREGLFGWKPSLISRLLFLLYHEQKSNFEMAVIDKIRSMRIERNLSQMDIGKFINTTRGFVGQVENPCSRSHYSLNQINKIAIGLKCSPHDLIPDKTVKN